MNVKDLRTNNKLGEIPVGCVFKLHGDWYMKILTDSGVYYNVHLETGKAYYMSYPNDAVDVPLEVELQILN